MPLEILVPAIVAALVPYLATGGEKLVEKTVEEGFENRAKIWQKVKGLFPDNELTTLNLFAENPDDPKLQGKVEGKLEDRLANNLNVAEELEKLLRLIPHSQVKQNTIKQTGDTNIAVQDVSGSEIKINK